MSPTPEARLTRWRTTANAVWAIIGILILDRGEWLGGGQGRERARPLRPGVPARVLHAGSRGGLRQAGSGQGRRCRSHLRHRLRRRLDTGRLPGSTREQASRRVREGRTELLRCSEDVRLRPAGTLQRSGRSRVAPGGVRLDLLGALGDGGQDRQRGRPGHLERRLRHRDRRLRRVPGSRRRLLGAQGPAQDP